MSKKNKEYYLLCQAQNCGGEILVKDTGCHQIMCHSCLIPLCRHCGIPWQPRKGGLRHKVNGKLCKFEGYRDVKNVKSNVTLSYVEKVNQESKQRIIDLIDDNDEKQITNNSSQKSSS